MRPSCPPRRSNERIHGHPQNPPLQHVTWRAADSLRAISFGLMALGGSSSLPHGGQKRPKTLVGSAHSMATLEMANMPWTAGHPFFHPPSFSPLIHIRAVPIFLNGLEFLFYSPTHDHPSQHTTHHKLLFLYFSLADTIKPAGALDGHDHNSDQDRLELISKDPAWTLIFVPDDPSGDPEDFAFATTLDSTQISKTGERTVFRYGCYSRGWYGYTEPRYRHQQQREQREPEQHV